MVSTCIDPVFHDLNFLWSKVNTSRLLSRRHIEILDRNFSLLRIFLLSIRKWGNNDLYLECNDKWNMCLQSFVSSIEDTVKRYAADVHSFCLGKQSELGHLPDMISNFEESIRPLKLEITKVYTALLDCSSLQSGPCVRDDELVELVDSLIKWLVYLRSGQSDRSGISHDAQAVLVPFEAKLIFLKNLIRFSILQCVQLGQLEDLLTCIHVVSLNAAHLCYACDVIEGQNEMCSLISKQIPKIADIHLFETCIKILRASKSSANLQSVARDKHIKQDFNDSLIINLWEIMLCSFVFMDSVKDQVEILYTGLKFFRNILREPPEKMDQLNEKIESLISEAGVILCSISMNQVKEGEVNSLQVRDALDCYAMLVDINSAIKLIKDQISGSSMIGDRPSNHSFKGQAIPKSSSLVISKHKIALSHDVVVGFDDEAKTVVDRLIGGSRQLEVVPIVGMPGLGKTTLAKKINKNPSITSYFHIRLWCCVSQVYGKKNLILQLLSNDNKYSMMNEDDLRQRLYQELKGKKYLVVFDDVWNIEFWNDLRISFPNDENGSRILFTSRFSNVASQVEFGKEPHNLRLLIEHESWELLQKKVFGNEDCPQELRILGKEIAKNCKGLPLTIVVIAGVLATIEHHRWGEVAKGLTSTVVHEKDLCKNTLQMSYEHLLHYLKPCFLYFGAFPEDQEIKTEKLMWLWIAEGFVQNTEPNRLEDVAKDYMMDLIGRNLVMVSKKESVGGVKACCIHDLLHEFCKSKAKEENFLLMLKEYDELYAFIEPPDLQRLSIFSTLSHFKKSRILCSNLSSLLFFYQVKHIVWLSKADILFICCIYKHLRVLDLVSFILDCGEFPVEINVLVELRNLAIQATVGVIPPSIANLSNLETFLVEACCHDFVFLPETIWNMKKLRHLHIGGHGFGSLPEGTLDNTSTLHNLDTIPCLYVSSGKCLEKIVKKIPNVRQLEIRLKPSTSYGGCAPLVDSLNQLESLESLNISSDCHFGDNLEYCFPSTLKELTLGHSHLPWSKISLVEELPNLEILKLLSKSLMGKRWDMKVGGFPKLRVLHLEGLDVVEWTDTDCDGNCFPCLEKVRLIKLSKLIKVPSCLGTIPTLKMIQVKIAWGNESIVSLVRKIEGEQQSYGNETLEILIEH